MTLPGIECLNSALAASTVSNIPKIGDHVIAMWGQSKWQYFTATIVSWSSETLEFTIDWDDNDPTGRVVSYKNVALDKTPQLSDISVGTKVLFAQGKYN